MKSDRVRRLIDRELDGEISPTERAELERAIHLCRDGRTERAGWTRILEGLAGAKVDADAPRLNTAKMASAIVAELPRRRREALPRRVAFAAAAAVMVATVVRGAETHPRPEAGAAGPQIAQARVAEPPSPVPVVIHVDAAGLVDDAEAVPVEISF